MSVTYGFYNSFNGDRRYNAEQFGAIFDGVIEDGVYQYVTKDSNTAPFAVTPNGGASVNVDVGRAWLNHTWTYNDANMSITLPDAHALYPRTDAIVIDVNLIERTNAITYVQASTTSASRLAELTWDTTNDHYQYLIAYITRPAGSSEITAENIAYKVGVLDDSDPNARSKLKYVTSPVQSYSLESYYLQWKAAWENWYGTVVGDGTSGSYPTAWQAWIDSQEDDFAAWLRNANRSIPSGSTANLIARLEAVENLVGGIESAEGYSYTDALTDAGGANLYDSTGAVLDGRIAYIMAGRE